MRIKAIEPIAVSLPMKKPVKMAGETVTRADNMLVRIETDDGVVGWGEAAAAPTMTGETVASMMAAVVHMAPGLLKRAGRRYRRRGGGDGRADVRQQRRQGGDRDRAARSGRPRQRTCRCTRCSAASAASRIPLLAVIGSDDAAADLREAQERRDAGYVIYKIKVGVDCAGSRRRAHAGHLPRARQRTASFPPMPIRVLTRTKGVRYVRAVADSGLDFFEQPVHAHDLAGMAQVAAASRVLIGADEGIHSLDDIERHHAAKAAHGVSLKAIKLGGVQRVLDASKLCDRLGMNVNISCKTGELSVASAAALHLAAVVPSLAWGLTVTSPGLADDVVTDPLRIDNGHMTVLDRPGLGVEVDERRVRRWQQEFTPEKSA